MERREYRTVDKSTWPRGPWDNEPDKVQWQDEATGFPCLIVRNEVGALCGYVGISTQHPLYGKDYDDAGLSIHGGLTFAASCDHSDEATGICHVPAAGEPDNIWWFGFDCAHAFDRMPGIEAIEAKLGETAIRGCIYRDLAYVTAECQSLSKQLKEIFTEETTTRGTAE